MRTRLLSRRLTYDGTQLASHWAFRELGLKGDCLVAFRGPCWVPTESLVDLVDARRGEFIRAREMLHFVAEHFELDLEAAILRQYLLISIVQDELNARQRRLRVERRGNDLFCKAGKLSVSIATLTPVSSKIHLGLNIDSSGAPVKASDLRRLGVDSRSLARAVLWRYAQDFKSMREGRIKVRAAI